MTLVQTMRTQFTALDPDCPLDEAAEDMVRSNQWLLPVCTGSCLVGSLSLLDLVSQRYGQHPHPTGSKVADAMSRQPLCCGTDASLEDARSLICRSRQPAICVTSHEGDLVGVIDAFEVIDALMTPQSYVGPEPEEVQRVRGG